MSNTWVWILVGVGALYWWSKQQAAPGEMPPGGDALLPPPCPPSPSWVEGIPPGMAEVLWYQPWLQKWYNPADYSQRCVKIIGTPPANVVIQ